MLKLPTRRQATTLQSDAKGFLSTMKTEQPPPFEKIRFVPQQFCGARYGEILLDGARREKIDRTLERIGRI